MAGKTKKRPREVAISDFKAKCLSLVEEVNQTKTPLRITRRGKPIAEIVPARPESQAATWIGSLAGTIDIRGDIVSPVIEIGKIKTPRK